MQMLIWLPSGAQSPPEDVFPPWLMTTGYGTAPAETTRMMTCRSRRMDEWRVNRLLRLSNKIIYQAFELGAGRIFERVTSLLTKIKRREVPDVDLATLTSMGVGKNRDHKALYPAGGVE